MEIFINFENQQLQAGHEPLSGFVPVSDYAGYVVDDALSGRKYGADQYAKCHTNSRIIGWQCGFEPMLVIVNSYLSDVEIETDEAIELATDYLEEINWFSDGATDPDIVI